MAAATAAGAGYAPEGAGPRRAGRGVRGLGHLGAADGRGLRPGALRGGRHAAGRVGGGRGPCSPLALLFLFLSFPPFSPLFLFASWKAASTRVSAAPQVGVAVSGAVESNIAALCICLEACSPVLRGPDSLSHR